MLTCQINKACLWRFRCYISLRNRQSLCSNAQGIQYFFFFFLKKTSSGYKTTSINQEGTKSSHYRIFINQVIDLLDALELKGFHLIIDNASLHYVRTSVEQRGYQRVNLPSYSPFLNLIKKCWAKIKATCQRECLVKNETITHRIFDPASLVTLDDLKGWIGHSISFLPLCLKKVQNF